MVMITGWLGWRLAQPTVGIVLKVPLLWIVTTEPPPPPPPMHLELGLSEFQGSLLTTSCTRRA
jgi:hypothetical protein